MTEPRVDYITVHIGDVANFDIPAAGVDLAQRKRDLSELKDDPAVMVEHWEALAADFEAIGQTIAGANCRKRASEWRAKA